MSISVGVVVTRFQRRVPVYLGGKGLQAVLRIFIVQSAVTWLQFFEEIVLLRLYVWSR